MDMSRLNISLLSPRLVGTVVVGCVVDQMRSRTSRSHNPHTELHHENLHFSFHHSYCRSPIPAISIGVCAAGSLSLFSDSSCLGSFLLTSSYDFTVVLQDVSTSPLVRKLSISSGIKHTSIIATLYFSVVGCFNANS